ncbi:hypothetical protein SBOR_5102 [Sclerotinia borealis F-4128]|uniref:Uncharacterized protein n=1 Tax=Sclerotinia borealis (strain F-4128) TaxID=1432307 RepID=W9CCN3_SCLBF|nr:hypothetical protein SBOR_5102 [Sclerotinia borealis F-4128]
MSKPQGLGITTNSMAYPDTRNHSARRYQYIPVSIDHTQHPGSQSIRGENNPSVGPSHQSGSSINVSSHVPSNRGLDISGDNIAHSGARRSHDKLPSLYKFFSIEAPLQSLGSPSTSAVPRQFKARHSIPYDGPSSSKNALYTSIDGSRPGSSSSTIQYPSLPKPAPRSSVDADVPSEPTSQIFLTKSERSDKVSPRVFGDMYNRMMNDFNMLRICLLGFATAHPESYSSEVAAYLSVTEAFAHQLFLSERRMSQLPFSKREREDLVPIYHSIYSSYHGLDIGNGSFIRHFVLHAIKIMRQDIRTIENHELFQDARKKRKPRYTQEEDFDPTGNRIAFDCELRKLEQELRGIVGPFSESDAMLYWRKQPGNYAGPLIKSKSASEAMNTEAGSMAFTKMLKSSDRSREGGSDTQIYGTHEDGVHDVKMMRETETKKRFITVHLKNLQSTLFRFLCSIFLVSLSHDLINFWTKTAEENPLPDLPIRNLIPAIREVKHMIMDDIREISTEDLANIRQRWTGSVYMYQSKWRQAVEDRAAIERELQGFEKQLDLFDREWNNQNIHSSSQPVKFVAADFKNLKSLVENNMETLKEMFPEYPSLEKAIDSALRMEFPDLQSLDQDILLSEMLDFLTLHNEDHHLSTDIPSTDNLNISQAAVENDASSITFGTHEGNSSPPVFIEQVEEIDTSLQATTGSGSVSLVSVELAEKFENIEAPLPVTSEPTSPSLARSDSPTIGHKFSHREIVGIIPASPSPNPSPSLSQSSLEPEESFGSKSPELLHTEIHLTRTWELIQRIHELQALIEHSEHDPVSTSNILHPSHQLMEDWKMEREQILMRNEVIRKQLNLEGRPGQRFLERAIAVCDEDFVKLLQIPVRDRSGNIAQVAEREMLEVENDGIVKGKGKVVELYAESENDYDSDEWSMLSA